MIGDRAVLHPHVVVYEGAVIGDDTVLHSHATVREFCRVGNRVILQNGAVVGGDGFGFAKRADGTHHKIVQSGITVIEDDVEIQCLAAIDRATVGETRIGDPANPQAIAADIVTIDSLRVGAVAFEGLRAASWDRNLQTTLTADFDQSGALIA